jgi:hypothetical protein
MTLDKIPTFEEVKNYVSQEGGNSVYTTETRPSSANDGDIWSPIAKNASDLTANSSFENTNSCVAFTQNYCIYLENGDTKISDLSGNVLNTYTNSKSDIFGVFPSLDEQNKACTVFAGPNYNYYKVNIWDLATQTIVDTHLTDCTLPTIENLGIGVYNEGYLGIGFDPTYVDPVDRDFSVIDLSDGSNPLNVNWTQNYTPEVTNYMSGSPDGYEEEPGIMIFNGDLWTFNNHQDSGSSDYYMWATYFDISTGTKNYLDYKYSSSSYQFPFNIMYPATYSISDNTVFFILHETAQKYDYDTDTHDYLHDIRPGAGVIDYNENNNLILTIDGNYVYAYDNDGTQQWYVQFNNIQTGISLITKDDFAVVIGQDNIGAIDITTQTEIYSGTNDSVYLDVSSQKGYPFVSSSRINGLVYNDNVAYSYDIKPRSTGYIRVNEEWITRG